MKLRNHNKLNSSVYLILLLSLLVSVAVVCFIFWNSFQDGETSNDFSGQIEKLLKQILNVDSDDGHFHEHVRKLAHFVEFCILGCVCGCLMHLVKIIHGRYHIALGLLVVLSIAVIDEYIQSFTGRTSLVKDILIDFAGGLLGFALISLIVLLCQWFKQKRVIKNDTSK